MLSNNNSHREKVRQKKMSKLIRKAEEWGEWHGTWLEDALNQFFDIYPVKTCLLYTSPSPRDPL